MRARFRRACARLLNRLVEVEVIGQKECPLMLRWTFFDIGVLRAMIHYFPPEVTDRDPHDHPRPFLTFVLRGEYLDTSWFRIDLPDQEFMKEIEIVGAGEFRYRPAAYTHIVETMESGCWSLVVMGPAIREWGFLRLNTGEWWPWGKYIQRWGGVIRCDAPADKMGIPVEDVPTPLGWTIDGDEDPTPGRPFRTHIDYRGTPPPLD